MTDIKPRYIHDTDYNLKVAYNTRFSKKKYPFYIMFTELE